MGIWAFYNAHSQTAVEHWLQDNTSYEEEPFFDLNIGKAFHWLHRILTGSDEPIFDNILSNAVLGKYGYPGFDWGSGCWWFECYCGSYIDNKTVKQIAEKLKDLQLKDFPLFEECQVQEWIEDEFNELKKFYQKAAEQNLAVETFFG